MLNLLDNMPPAVLTALLLFSVIFSIRRAYEHEEKVNRAREEGRPAPTLAETASNPIDRAAGTIFMLLVWALAWAAVLFIGAAIVGAGWRFLR